MKNSNTPKSLREKILLSETDMMIEMLDCFADGLIPITDDNGNQLTKEQVINYYRNEYWQDKEQDRLDVLRSERNQGCSHNCKNCIHSGLCDEEDSFKEDDYIF